MVNLPSVRHLRHLVALSDCGHFGRAAEACRVTQSTLSASIKELEAVLEAILVDRTKRRVVLTPVGIETVERAHRIIKDIEELVSFTASAREPLSGALRMGAIPTVGPFLLPRVLPGFSSAWLRANKRHSNMTACLPPPTQPKSRRPLVIRMMAAVAPWIPNAVAFVPPCFRTINASLSGTIVTASKKNPSS